MGIFIYSCPYGYKKLNLTIFEVIPDPIHGIFIVGIDSINYDVYFCMEFS